MNATDVATRATELCAAPAGCAFLLAVEESGLTLEEAVDPVAAAFLAALAIEEMSPWFGAHDRVVAMALAHGPRLLPLARDLLALPAAEKWFAPLDRRAQQWICSPGKAASAPMPVRPDRAPDGWERYAQKADWGLWTSTELDEAGTVTSFLACIAYGTGDIGVDFEPPFGACRLTVAPAARVLEITGPQAWHHLCARYPAIGDDGRLVPDWAAVAADWDGVHLTLGGLLTSEQVRIESALGWTEHGGWDAEQTLWLRDVFVATLRLPNLTELVEPPAWLRSPPALWIQPGPDTWPWLVSLGPGTEGDAPPRDWPFPEDGPPLRQR